MPTSGSPSAAVSAGTHELALRLALLAFIGVGGGLLTPTPAFADACSCNEAACRSVGFSGCCSGSCECQPGVCICPCC